MESKNIAANHVRSKIERILQQMDIRRSAVKKFSDPIRSITVCEDIWSIMQYRQRLAEKKVANLPPLRDTLIAPDPNDPNATILELDEWWSFVFKKVNKVWIWIALCRKTRQVVA
jgi:hypothetical protein